MTRSEKYAHWLMLSDYDLETIPSLVEGQRWVYVAYLCQQAVERQLKGMYVYYNDAEAPKTHNINFLFNKIIGSDRFRNGPDFRRFEEGRYACEDFLVDAMFYYLSDYPFSYKNITSRFIEKDAALALCVRTQQYIQWLRSFQPDNGAMNV